MAVFHSLAYNAILSLAQRVPSGIVPGDCYFANDRAELFVAATDGALVPFTSIIMSGNITGAPGPTGPQGPAGESASSNLAIQSGNYQTLATDGTVLCTGAVAQTITLLATGIFAGQKFTVTVLSTATATVTVASQNAETIENEDSADLYAGDSADFCWTGSDWVIQ
jgi:hypothetical protein